MELQDIIKTQKDEKEVNTMSPLIWAYVGDCVYELYVRTHLVNTTKLKPHFLHIECTKYVKAQAQAHKLFEIEEFLTEEEKDLVRRARNTQNHHLPKNAKLEDYQYATALEGLIGYLYLTNQTKRLQEILGKLIKKDS